jgi:hypothetical protein
VSIVFSTFRVVGSVSGCSCLQCRHFQVGGGAGDEHEYEYVHLCSITVCSLLDGVTDLFLFVFLFTPVFAVIDLSCPLFSTFQLWWAVFLDAYVFNADISKWEVHKVTTMGRSTSTSVSTLFVHWTVSLIGFFDLFSIHPCCVCRVLHHFIVFDVSGGDVRSVRRFGW